MRKEKQEREEGRGGRKEERGYLGGRGGCGRGRCRSGRGSGTRSKSSSIVCVYYNKVKI
jgi:hypothetical protein